MDWKYGNIGSHVYDATLIGEIISKSLKKNKNIRCFNCDKQVHMKRDCRQGISRNIVFFFIEIIQKEGPSFLEYAEGMAKAYIGLMNADEQKTGKVIFSIGKSPRGPHVHIKLDSGIPFPVSFGKLIHKANNLDLWELLETDPPSKKHTEPGSRPLTHM
jgi:hypothetical protein